MCQSTVEDSVFILNMATQILRKRGHTVETAANGSAGLSRLEAVCATDDDFDLVLCDFQMPVLLSVSQCVFCIECTWY